MIIKKKNIIKSLNIFILKSNFILGVSLKYTNTKLYPYIFGKRFKIYYIDLKFLKYSLIKNFKLIKSYLLNKQKILLIGNSSNIKFLLKRKEFVKKGKNFSKLNIRFYKKHWINGFLTNKIIKQRIKMVILLNVRSNPKDILIETLKLKIPVIYFFNINMNFLALNKILYPSILNVSNPKAIFSLMYILRNLLNDCSKKLK